MIESVRVEQWLYTTLTGDATLAAAVSTRCYGYIAPQNAIYPLLLFSMQAGTDVMGVGTARVMLTCLYQVKVIGATNSFAALKPLADRIDAVLQGATGSVVDGAILACTREEPLSYVDVSGETQYRHLGGLYRIIAQGI